MKHLATFILFLGWCLVVNAQAPLVKQWDYRYGGTGKEYLHSFQQTNDRGYISGGRSYSGIGGDKTQSNWDSSLIYPDYWVVKIDAFGNKQWDKRYGGTDYDMLTSLQQCSDGGYILGGWSASGTNGDKTLPSWGQNDYWIIKIDSLGNKQWDKRFGGTETDVLYSLQQTIDGGYILGGESYSGISGDKTQANWDTATLPTEDYWVVKIDSLGTKQWDRRFGGKGKEQFRSLSQTSDGGYILGGYSYSGISGDKTENNWDTTLLTPDFWVVKIDPLGNTQWDKRFGGNGHDYLRSLLESIEGGYILAGYSNSGISGDKTQTSWGYTDYWIVKIDSLGTKQWDKRFGGVFGEDYFGNIFQTSDRGYLLTGTSYSPLSGDKSENNLGQGQTWIVKTDSLGNKQWDKTILSNGGYDYGFAIQTNDGCYVSANYTDAGIGGYKTQINRGDSDYWIVKFCDSAHMCNLAPETITTTQITFCSGDSAQVCAPSGFASYLWNTGEITACIKAKLAGNYYVTVTDNSGCTAESNRIAISVYPLPPVAISVNGDTLSVYGAVTQQWYLNGSAINNATSNIYIATQGGSYTVAVTDTNGCTATSSAVIISGIDNVTEEDVVSVYPNPTQSTWQLTVGNNLLGGTAEVYDANGRAVYYSLLTTSHSLIAPDVSKGVYLLRITSGKSSVVRKLVRW